MAVSHLYLVNDRLALEAKEVNAKEKSSLIASHTIKSNLGRLVRDQLSCMVVSTVSRF